MFERNDFPLFVDNTDSVSGWLLGVSHRDWLTAPRHNVVRTTVTAYIREREKDREGERGGRKREGEREREKERGREREKERGRKREGEEREGEREREKK